MTVAGNGFEGLVAQLGEAFSKAQSLEDDQKIEAAAGDAGGEAAEAAAGDGSANADEGAGADCGADCGAGDGNEEEEEEGEGESFGKSFSLTLDDGSTVEAFDGVEMLKSFGEKMDAIAAGSQSALQGALAVINKQNEVIEKQGQMLKSLQADVTRLANSGAGRKSVSAIQTPAAEEFNKSEASESSPHELLAKCLSAQATGKISAFDSSRANIAVEMGMPIPADIVARLA